MLAGGITRDGNQQWDAAARERIEEAVLVGQIALDDGAEEGIGHLGVSLLRRERERLVIDDRVQADPQLRVRGVQPAQLRPKVLPDAVDRLVEHCEEEKPRRVR